jgi:hypothetical protein
MSFQFSEFYVTGGTLKRGAACYVERQADTDLYNKLVNRTLCYVLTTRQTGKSSLMVRTAERLRDTGIKVAVLDLTAFGQNLTAEQWYDGLIARVGQQLHLERVIENFWVENERVAPLLRWIRAIREVILTSSSRPIVIFIDEIDAVRSLPFSTDEFFAGIRQFHNGRSEDPELERVTFCLLGVAKPSDLITNPNTTPFNIGERIELSDFTDQEALTLVRGLRRRDREARLLLSSVLWWTGGHPYLTQRLCRAVAEDRTITADTGVDQLCETLFLTSRAQLTDDNLVFVRERVLAPEEDRLALLDLYARVRSRELIVADETDPVVSTLRLSGIVRVIDGCLYVRNQIYDRVFDQQWIESNIPDAERRRQKSAFREGFVRAILTLIGVGLVAVVLVVFGISTMYSRSKSLEYGYKYASLAKEAQKLRAENVLLRAQKDADSSRLFFQRLALQIEVEKQREKTLRTGPGNKDLAQ